MITADPLAWYRPDRDRIGVENYDDLVAAVRNPDTVKAMLEDYRASLHVDRAIDEADRAAGRQIRCPTLVAWSAHDDMEDLYGDPTLVWRALVRRTATQRHHRLGAPHGRGRTRTTCVDPG